MRDTIDLTVAELDCADEAQQIQSALGRLDGVVEVRTAVSSRTAMVAYESERVGPEAIRAAIRNLGMTVVESRESLAPRRRSLPELLGWAFVSVIAIVALLGIAGEWLGLGERLADWLPAWLLVTAVVVGAYPIVRSVVRALRNRHVTSHALMTLGIVGARQSASMPPGSSSCSSCGWPCPSRRSASLNGCNARVT